MPLLKYKKNLSALIAIFIVLNVFASIRFGHSALQENFLVINDIHLDAYKKTPMDINPIFYGYSNDLDTNTFFKFLETIKQSDKEQIVPTPKFIIFLGDTACHRSYKKPAIIVNQTIVFTALKKYFPATPVFYVFGNGDSLLKNYGPFTDQNGLKSPYQIAKNSGWRDGFLSSGKICDKDKTFPCIITEDISHGYYSAYVQHGLRLLALNSNLFSVASKGDMMGKNAKAELNWLKQQLQAARMEKNTVLLAMHIPPGNDVFTHQNFWKSSYKKAFIQLAATYQENIVGILAAHTHMNEVKVLRDTKQKDIALAVLSPGLSTSHGNAASFNSVNLSLTQNNWLLTNYETFRFLKDNKNNFSIKKVYDYKTYYCTNRSARSVLECTSNITANKIKKYYTSGNPNFQGVMLSPSDFIVE